MTKTTLITFKVTDEQLIKMDEQVKAGDYSGRSALCRDAIEELIAKEQSQDRAVSTKIQEAKP